MPRSRPPYSPEYPKVEVLYGSAYHLSRCTVLECERLYDLLDKPPP